MYKNATLEEKKIVYYTKKMLDVLCPPFGIEYKELYVNYRKNWIVIKLWDTSYVGKWYISEMLLEGIKRRVIWITKNKDLGSPPVYVTQEKSCDYNNRVGIVDNVFIRIRREH